MPKKLTKKEAEHVLEEEFGTREHMIAGWNRALPGRVVRAIEALGGAYQRDWGITRMPPLWKLWKGVKSCD
jgi:hypothetical protein